MSAPGPSTLQRVTTWLMVILAAVLLAWGALQYGWSPAVHERFWADITSRIHGPMTFRYLLQPTMALLAAVPDGIRDVRRGHKVFFWSALWNPKAHTGRLREGLVSIARVALLGISMDVLYQFRVFGRFYPVEALMMALLLAVIPYFSLRWLTENLARRWFPANPLPHTERHG